MRKINEWTKNKTKQKNKINQNGLNKNTHCYRLESELKLKESDR